MAAELSVGRPAVRKVLYENCLQQSSGLHRVVYTDARRWSSRMASISAHRLSKTSKAVCRSINFQPDASRFLKRLAAAKEVLLASIVRDAAEKYTPAQLPLLGQSSHGERS